MLNIFWRIIKDRKISLLVYCLAMVGFLWMYVALFPSLQESFELIDAYVKTLPEGFLKAFGFETEAFRTFEGYIATEHFSFIWPIVMIILMMSFAGGAIAGEIDKGTIEIILSQPISRIKIFFSKYLASIFTLLVFVLASIASVFPMASIYDISVKTENFIKLGILGFIFGLAIFGISMLFSVIFSEKGKVYFITAGILILMYVVNIISALKENLEDLRYGSFFYYFNPTNALVHNKIDNLAYYVFLGTFVTTTILAVIWFEKRDIAV